MTASFRRSALPLLAVAALASGCDLFGSKQDDTTDDIYRQGRIDPNAVSDVGYVPVQPFYTQASTGTFNAPTDVYVGFDGFVYVTDANGLHVLNRAGQPQRSVAELGGQPIREAGCVTQDRRLQVYVCALRDTTTEVERKNSVGRDTVVIARVSLPVVYRISGMATGTPKVEDIIWQPYTDLNRVVIRRYPIPEDEQVRFVGVGVRPDNSIYVARRGPLAANVPQPYNGVLGYDATGANTGQIIQVSGRRASLLSSFNPTDVITTVHPPQRQSFPNTADFFVAQSPLETGDARPPTAPLANAVLSIKVTETTDGITYGPDVSRLGAAQTATGLYTINRFLNPSDLAFAADGTNYLFVLDSGKDSLFVFNNAGIEGVAPPPGARNPAPVKVSFGGAGNGLLTFNRPQGVAYYDKTVYVADTGNNRIARFRLNTDLE